MDLKLSGLVVHRAVTLAKESKLISVFVAPNRFPGSVPSHHTDKLPSRINLFQTTLFIFLATTTGTGRITPNFLRACYRLGTQQWHNAVGGTSSL